MKRLLLIVSLSFFTLFTFAQADNKVARRIQLDERTIVKDSAGIVLPIAEWRKLIGTGKYRLSPIDITKEKVEFQLISVTASQKATSVAPAANQPVLSPPPMRRLTVNENSIVKDSTGVRLPFAVVEKLVGSNDYWLKPVDPNQENTEFVLVAYTEQQKASRYINSPRPTDSKFFTTGAAIKSFKIKDINGKKIEAKDWIGKTVVLNFWFIGCPPCRAEIPDLNKLALKYKDNPNVIFIAIALDQYWEVGDYVKQNPLAYHLVGDGQSIADMFNVHLYPTNVVVNKQGKVALHYSAGYPQGPYWIDKTIQESEAAKTEM